MESPDYNQARLVFHAPGREPYVPFLSVYYGLECVQVPGGYQILGVGYKGREVVAETVPGGWLIPKTGEVYERWTA